MTQPIFYDASGRRALWVRGLMMLAGAILAGAAIWLWWTVTTFDAARPLRFAVDATRPQGFVERAQSSTKGAWLPAAATRAVAGRPPIVGFYMPWDEPSRRSLADHVGDLDWLVPGLASVTGKDHRFTYETDPVLRTILAGAAHAPIVLPMVQNAREDGGWDGEGTAQLLADPGARAAFIDRLTAMVAAERGGGVMLDLENLPVAAHPDYRRFLAELHARFAQRGWQVALAAPVADPRLGPRRLCTCRRPARPDGV